MEIFIIGFFVIAFFTSFIVIMVILLAKRGSQQTNAYHAAKGTSDFAKSFDKAHPLFSSGSKSYVSFNFYENDEGFLLDRSNIALKYNDIACMKATRYNSHRNMIAVAAAAGKPLYTLQNGQIQINDRCIISLITKSGTTFGTCPMNPADAGRFVNYIISKNHEIKWLET